ncbi:uncharacterized protein BKA78DRAFT_84481 [Phyllosticta capitalensis]|uniref:uncharacterized protein n=1 Tax=Phyllosticta capitalensis TaxID=121624 RepID=UPI00312FAD02
MFLVSRVLAALERSMAVLAAASIVYFLPFPFLSFPSGLFAQSGACRRRWRCWLGVSALYTLPLVLRYTPSPWKQSILNFIHCPHPTSLMLDSTSHLSHVCMPVYQHTRMSHSAFFLQVVFIFLTLISRFHPSP